MVNPIVKLSHEVASLRGRMAERLSNFEAVVDTVDPLVVTLPDGSQMEGLTPIGVQPRPGLAATVQVGEGRAWLLPHVMDGDPAPGELSPEVGAQISGLELGTERLADELLDVTAAARDFEQAYSLDRAETAAELGDIRDTATQAKADAEAALAGTGGGGPIRSLDPATGTTNPVTGQPLTQGATWWRMDKLTSGGKVIGQWGWTGTAWVAEQISHEAIASVAVNSLLVTDSARLNLAVVDKIVGDAGFYKLLTADKFASLDPGDGIYPDGSFKDPGLTAVRATNTGMTVAGGGLQGAPARVSLTARGADEGETIPLTPNELYSVQVWGVGFTTGWTLAIKHSNGVITNLPTVREGSTRLAATAVPTSAGARLLLNRTGTGTITITRVELRHGIGGTLIEGDAIATRHIKVDALDFWKATGMELTAPKLQTSLDATKGIKIIDDRLTGYGPAGQLQIDIGGPEGIIKGVALEGVTVTGTTSIVGANIATSASGVRVLLNNANNGSVQGISAGGFSLFSLMARDPDVSTQNDDSASLYIGQSGGGLGGSVRIDALNGIRFKPITGNTSARMVLAVNGDLMLDAPKVLINTVDVSGRTVAALSSNITLIKQGRSRQVRVSTNANLPEGNTSIFGTVPAADRPDANIFGTAYFAGFLGGAFVGTDGVVWITNRSGATRTAVQATINWTI